MAIPDGSAPEAVVTYGELGAERRGCKIRLLAEAGRASTLKERNSLWLL
ncbi:MAG: hypothetical protein IJF38_06965 [Clostridia bacterium]|nr:hypothetical protein [Clostridia bacterium]